MAISHTGHDHPATPAARAACRKQMANGDTPLTGNPIPSTIAGVMSKAIGGKSANISTAMTAFLRHWGLGESIDSTPATSTVRAAFRQGLVTGESEPVLTDKGWAAIGGKPAKIGRVISTEDEARLADGLVDGVHPRRAAKLNVVPRQRGDGGVVKGMKAAKPRTAKFLAADFSEDAMIAHNRGVVRGTKVKAYEKPIRTAGDLPADIPANLVRTIEAAWSLGWDVVEGTPLNGDESRVLIGGTVAQVSLVFNGAGRSGVFVRSLTSSLTRRVDSGPQALALASGDEDWPWMNGNKLV